MARSRFSIVLTAALSLIAMPVVALARLAGGFLRDAFALFTPEPMRLIADGHDLPLSIGGHALAADVQQSLRHEAGVSRRAAARNT